MFYFILTFFYNFVVAGQHVGTLATAMSEPTFWLTVLLTTVVLLVPVVAFRFYSVSSLAVLSYRLSVNDVELFTHRKVTKFGHAKAPHH